MIQYGEGNRIVLGFAWSTHNAATEMLRQHEVGVGVNRTVHLPLGQGKQLRVVRGYKHLGAMAAATLRFDNEVAAREAATSCAESALSRDMCAQAKTTQANLCQYCKGNPSVYGKCCGYVAVLVGTPKEQACDKVLNHPAKSGRQCLVFD